MSEKVRLTNAYRVRRDRAMDRVVALRASSPDAETFGIAVAALIDKLLADEAGGKPKYGAWTDAEKAILRQAYSEGATWAESATLAEGRLFRTRTQIIAMAGNMRIKPKIQAEAAMRRYLGQT